jgi:repressor LexA
VTVDAEPKPLTARQAQVLAFIKANMAYYSPTVRQIAVEMGIRNHNAVFHHLNALEKKGRIRRVPGKSRNIEVIA